MLTVTCAYRVDAALVEALDRHLGPPLDSYVRGWQVWLEPNGPGGETLEWRLHPPAGFRMPRGVNPHDLFDVVLQGLAEAEDPVSGTTRGADDAGPEMAVGGERRRLREIWEALEVFPTFGEEIDPRALAAAATTVLGGRAPDVAGRVDHARMGDEWKGRRGDYSVAQVLFSSLDPPAGKPAG